MIDWKNVLRGHLIPEHAVGTSKAAPKNTVRNLYKKQLLSVLHFAPEELRPTWLRDWKNCSRCCELEEDYAKGLQVAGRSGRSKKIFEHPRSQCSTPGNHHDQKSCSRFTTGGIHGRESEVPIVPNGIWTVLAGCALCSLQTDERGTEKIHNSIQNS